MESEELEYPDIGLDMQLIARERLRILKSMGLVPNNESEPEIASFKCTLRGYLCTGQEFHVMFMPDAVDLPACVKSLIAVQDDTVECWILQDDRVIEYKEFTDETALHEDSSNPE